MLLLDLIKLKALLADCTVEDNLLNAVQSVVMHINRLAAIPNMSEENLRLLAAANETYSSIFPVITSFNTLLRVRNAVTDQIDEIAAPWLKKGYSINGVDALVANSPELERKHPLVPQKPDTINRIKDRINQHVHFTYPGLEIGPGDGEWTPNLVACDPLYLADIYPEFLEITKKQFPPEYQSRLRTYLINRYRDPYDLRALPQGVFGFIFAWNVFNFFPYTELTRYLTELFGLLRPGGVIMFSYNNCDGHVEAHFAELGYNSWMPKSKLIPLCISLGFEVVYSEDPESTISWIEIKKPGTITSIKAEQVLGEIKWATT